MKVSYIVKRYIAILGRLSNNKKATFLQLIDAIERSGGEEARISQRTFQRMINDIEDLFHVKIKCNREGFYRIVEDESDLQHTKITQSLQFFNYQKHLENFESRIAYDKTCLVGQQFLYDIQNAISEKVCLEFLYTKYHPKKNESEQRIVAPFGLKEFRGRWYLVGKDIDKNEIRIFGLDRISELIVSNRRMMIPEDFDIQELFKHSVGISIDKDNISEIIELEFSSKLAGYVKNFPIHPSQTISLEDDDKIQIRLRTYINLELVNELMQFSDDVKVLKPKNLRKMLIQRANDILQNNN